MTLKHYLQESKNNLYEKIIELKQDIIDNNYAEEKAIELNRAESALQVLRDITDICIDRGRF